MLNEGAKRVDTDRVRSDGLLDPGIIEAALSTLLHGHAEAVVCALGPDGLKVAMPGSVPVAGHRVVEARSPLNLVVGADRVAMISAWERARALGASRVAVRLASDPHSRSISSAVTTLTRTPSSQLSRAACFVAHT